MLLVALSHGYQRQPEGNRKAGDMKRLFLTRFKVNAVKASSEMRIDSTNVKRIGEDKHDDRHSNVPGKGDESMIAPKSWRDRMEDSEWRMQQRMQYRRETN